MSLSCCAGVDSLSLHDDTVASSAAADASSNQANDSAKKVRNLQKKLKQIQQLKEKRSAGGSSGLTHEQVQKLDSEGSVLSELQQLEQSA